MSSTAAQVARPAAPVSPLRAPADRSPAAPRRAEESAWLTAVGGGDAEALRRLWSRYRLPCLRLAHRVLGGSTHSEDVVQLVFLDVWRHAGRYDPARASAGSWILAMTHHKAVDRVRHEQRRAALAVQLAHGVGAPCGDDVAVDVVRRHVVERALAGLSTPQRQVLRLAFFGGMTYAEIGMHLHVPLGTVKTRGRVGLLNLHARLAELGEVV